MVTSPRKRQWPILLRATIPALTLTLALAPFTAHSATTHPRGATSAPTATATVMATTTPTTPTATTPTVTAITKTIAPPPLAVVVRYGAYSSYVVSLVGIDGRVVARASAAGRGLINTTGAVAVPLPVVSASATRVYYLDGDARVRSLAPNGTTAIVATVPGGPRAHAAFAVSPDDRRIAVSVLDYSGRVPRMRLYTQGLASATQSDIFTSSQVYEWPIAWRNGALVLAILRGGAYVQNTAANPYDAFDGYHVVDATSGTRLATLCPAGVSVGPVVAAGTMCVPNAGQPYVQDLTGATHPFVGAGDNAVLAPDGSRVAASDGHSLFLLDATGRRTTLKAQGLPQGWIDATHLLISAGYGVTEPLSILNVRDGARVPLAIKGQFVGTLPGLQ